MHKGERYEVAINVTINGQKLPESEWSKPDSDCNVWREAVMDGTQVRLIMTHTIKGMRIFCTVIAIEKEAEIVCNVQVGTLAFGSECLFAAKGETKTGRVEIVL